MEQRDTSFAFQRFFYMVCSSPRHAAEPNLKTRNIGLHVQDIQDTSGPCLHRVFNRREIYKNLLPPWGEGKEGRVLFCAKIINFVSWPATRTPRLEHHASVDSIC